jgi:hypothetical protein
MVYNKLRLNLNAKLSNSCRTFKLYIKELAECVKISDAEI